MARSLVFEIGGQAYAIPSEALVELLPALAYRAVPGGPAWALGLIDRRGTLIPLVDAVQLLGGARWEPTVGSRVAVVIAEASRGDAGLVGLLVPSVLGFEPIDFAGPGSHPGFQPEANDAARPDARHGHLGRVTRHRGTTVQEVVPSRLLDDSVKRVLFGASTDGART